MAEFVLMPKLGFDMQEGVLNTWLKEIGETVNKGDIIAEIESDKATLELESQLTGTLVKTLVQAGDIVPVGARLAIVGEPDEDVTGLLEGVGKSDSIGKAKSEQPARADVTTTIPSEEVKLTPVESSDYPGGVRATPVARRIAEERGIDLRRVNGSGPDGRIRRADVESFEAAPASKAAGKEMPEIVAGPESSEHPTSRLRQTIGRRMTESKTSVPHFYVTNEIDMEAALVLRRKLNALLPEEEKITVNDMILKAAALALREFPNLNASYAGANLLRHHRINIGSAVAVEGGLLTVVQKNTDSSSLRRIAADNRAMIERARSGKIHPDDISGGTFTVSNLGAFDVDHFIAIINPPDAAILAIGSAKQVPVVQDGELRVGTRMKATISADHRVTDGAEAARFLQAFKVMLEEPLRLTL